MKINRDKKIFIRVPSFSTLYYARFRISCRHVGSHFNIILTASGSSPTSISKPHFSSWKLRFSIKDKILPTHSRCNMKGQIYTRDCTMNLPQLGVIRCHRLEGNSHTFQRQPGRPKVYQEILQWLNKRYRERGAAQSETQIKHNTRKYYNS